MIDKRRTYDVFVSHAQIDRKTAQIVVRALEERGLYVFPPSSGGPNPKDIWSDVNRDAISESKAFVVVLTPRSLKSQSILFHLGAALAWDMPVYVVSDGITKSQIPPTFKHAKSCSLADLSKMVSTIVRDTTRRPLSVDEEETLATIYGKIGVPSDELLDDPPVLRRLANRFNRKIHASFAPERLLKELIRLRKKGQLPKVRKVST